MACPETPVTMLTVHLLYVLALFGPYCQMAPAVAGATRGWHVGTGLKYKLTTTLLFSEAVPSRSSDDVGYRLTGELNVTAVWQRPDDTDSYLLRVELLQPQLWIKSRRAPEPKGFVEHSSRIDVLSQRPLFILWKNGAVISLFIDPSETVSSANLKRSLASLLQYRIFDSDVRERDASGLCNVTYHSLGPKTIEKRKTHCEISGLPPVRRHPNPLFGVKVASSRVSTYELTQELVPEVVIDEERHRMTLTARPEVGTTVSSKRTLEMMPGAISGRAVKAGSLKQVIADLGPGFKETSIELELEPPSPDANRPTIDQTIEEHRSALEASSLGTVKSASAFLKLTPLIKMSTTEELLKILKSPRNRQIRSQLLDMYGAASSIPSHQAAMKVLLQDEIGDDTERYLWALSLSPSPSADVAKNILKRSEETHSNDKVSETITLTAAAMARHLESSVAVEKARVSLEIGLDSCSGEECKLKFLRGLRNLRSKTALPTLVKFALGDNKALSVAAWKAISVLPKDSVTDEVKKAARRVFYQLDAPKRDSSARTFALDIILEVDPTKQDIEDLIKYLSSSDSAYEVKKYASQRLEQLSESDPRFSELLKRVLTENESMRRSTNVYNAFIEKGLSTAFTRSFLKSIDSNGSLVTVQEIQSGLMKRGIVDVVFEVGNHREALFSLGLFAGGLSSFVASNQDEEENAEEEAATAGMEIDFLGVGIRPFVFFSGQGELMGHVWSGTASERTPAFQALAALHNHHEYIPLGSGVVAEIDVQGATSFDLAGQIQLSLWSRNAQSLVDLKAGIVVQGGTKVKSDFVQSMAEFSMTLEPKLELATDVDFSGPVSLCMRLSQPENLIKYQVYKVERITGSRHKLRKTRRVRINSPGRCYLLNRKNNEMCSKVFS